MKRIGVVGASVRAMAASVRQAGWDAVAADLFADLDLRRLASVTQLDRFPWSALAWLSEADVDAWCYTGGFENYPRLIQRMAALKPLVGNGPDCLRRVRDPFWLAACMDEHGLAFPTVRRSFDTGHSLKDGWLRKPRRSAGGLKIEPAQVATPGHSGFYLQKQIVGEPRSVALLSSGSGVQIVGVCRLAVGLDFGAPGSFVFAGASMIPLPDVAESEELCAMAQVLHDEAAMCGLWGFDYVLAERPYLLEVNPRWTATMALYERGSRFGMSDSLMRRHIAACLGTSDQPLPPSSGRHAMRILYAAKRIEVTPAMIDLVGGSGYLEGSGVLRPPSIADLPVPGSRIEPGEPVCTIYTDEETMGRLDDQVAKVRHAFQAG